MTFVCEVVGTVKTCRECSEFFTDLPHSGRAKLYCSPNCARNARNKMWNERRARKRVPKSLKVDLCPFCGEVFVIKAYQHKFCSKPCRARYFYPRHPRQRTPKVVIENQPKTCKRCGVIFTGRSNDYCSKSCYKKARRREESVAYSVCKQLGINLKEKSQ